MQTAQRLLEELSIERPVGTAGNEKALQVLEREFAAAGCEVETLPFDCLVWEQAPSTLRCGGREWAIQPGPLSLSAGGSGPLVVAHTFEELQAAPLAGSVLLMAGKLAQSDYAPKDYPFYYPDEHRAVIELLEEARPLAIIGATGGSVMHGQSPFPLFIDGNFDVPSACIADAEQPALEALAGQQCTVAITSRRIPATGRQLLGRLAPAGRPKGTILLCAHMDTQYDTPGALDNAAGTAVLMLAMQRLAALPRGEWELQFVPFNGEENYAAPGQMQYFARMEQTGGMPALVINIDGPGFKGGQTEAAFYNEAEALAPGMQAMLDTHGIRKGEPWYAGDHAYFTFRGVPCLTLTSGGLFEGALAHTHTPRDTPATVDAALLEQAADFLAALVPTL